MTSGAGTSSCRPDVLEHLAHPAAAELLLLAGGHPARVADDPALAAAERDVGQRALPGHPGGQRAHGVGGLLGVEADAALGRPAQIVVLDAEAAEDLDRPVVHAHRDGEVELAHGPAQQLAHARLEAELIGHAVELRLGHFEGIEFFAHDVPSGIWVFRCLGVWVFGCLAGHGSRHHVIGTKVTLSHQRSSRLESRSHRENAHLPGMCWVFGRGGFGWAFDPVARAP